VNVSAGNHQEFLFADNALLANESDPSELTDFGKIEQDTSAG